MQHQESQPPSPLQISFTLSLKLVQSSVHQSSWYPREGACGIKTSLSNLSDKHIELFVLLLHFIYVCHALHEHSCTWCTVHCSIFTYSCSFINIFTVLCKKEKLDIESRQQQQHYTHPHNIRYDHTYAVWTTAIMRPLKLDEKLPQRRLWAMCKEGNRQKTTFFLPWAIQQWMHSVHVPLICCGIIKSRSAWYLIS